MTLTSLWLIRRLVVRPTRRRAPPGSPPAWLSPAVALNTLNMKGVRSAAEQWQRRRAGA